MSGPAQAITTDDGRFYTWPRLEGQHLPSITTVIKQGVPKPHLQAWAVKLAAQAALENIVMLARLQKIQAVHDADR